MGADDEAYHCVFQQEDSEGIKGVKLDRVGAGPHLHAQSASGAQQSDTLKFSVQTAPDWRLKLAGQLQQRGAMCTGCTAGKDRDFLAIMLRSAFISAGACAGSRQSAAAQPAAARAPHPASGGAAALLGKHGGLQIFKG